jgi:hypothetical protein
VQHPVWTDVPEGNVHREAIDCIAWYAITIGSRGSDGDTASYDPRARVTRGQMASFLFRLGTEAGIRFPASPPDRFRDDDGSPHEAAIDALTAEGIVQGFDDGTYRPNAPVTRDQMAAFVVRTIERASGSLPAPRTDAPADSRASVHQLAIRKLLEAGIVQGFTDGTYRPREDVRRDQMATFLAGALELLVERGVVLPGGSVTYLDDTTTTVGGALEGTVVTVVGKTAHQVSAAGCGTDGQQVRPDGDGRFRLQVLPTTPPGECELELAVTSARADAGSEQTVPATFSVTVRVGQP